MTQLNVDKSMALHKEALKVLPAGVSSNARLWKRVCPIYTPCSLFIEKAVGSHIWDVDGNEYIDYRLGYGPVILGHSYPPVHDAVHSVDEKGLVYAFSHELEIKVAKQMISMAPSVDMVRFANSGTEATMHAIRVARSYTQKEKIVKFEGHYHGAHDYVLFSTEPEFADVEGDTAPRSLPASLGIPRAIRDLVIVQRWNDFEGLEETIRKHGDEIAAIITEPIMGNCSAITPQRGYLEFLRKICDENNIVLIFDEVKTGFRLARGGAQEVFGVKADLTTFAKSMGNGYPVAAIGGRHAIMEYIGPNKVVHGGTYSSNPLSLMAVHRTLELLADGRVHTYLNEYGRKLMNGIDDILNDAHIPHRILGMPPMFQILFTGLDSVKEYRDLSKCDLEFYARMQLELLAHGVMFDEDNMEVCFTCYSHGAEDLQKTLEAFEASVMVAKKEAPVAPQAG